MTISATTRRALWERSGGYCERCGRHVPLQDHHVTKRSQGGDDSLANQLLECHVCHEAEHGLRAIDGNGFCCDVCLHRLVCPISQAKEE